MTLASRRTHGVFGSGDQPCVADLYNALAVMAYLLRSIDPDSGWPARVVELIQSFPNSAHLTTESMGVPSGWLKLELWSSQ